MVILVRLNILSSFNASNITSACLKNDGIKSEYIIKKIKEEYGQNLKVVSTGGLGKLIAKETDLIDIYDQELTFKGLKIIYDKNKKDRH